MFVELLDMSKTYIRQETIEPAKKLGRTAGMSIAGAVLLALGAVFVVAAVYGLFQQVIFDLESEWFDILSRVVAFAVAALGAGLIMWRINSHG